MQRLAAQSIRQALATTCLLVGVAGTQASTLRLCDGMGAQLGVPGGGAGMQSFLEPGGGSLTLRLMDAATDAPIGKCQTVELPVSASEAVWSTLLGADDAARMTEGVALQGVVEGVAFSVSEIIPLPDAQAPAPSAFRPAGATPSVLPDWRAFGVEGRSRVDAAELVCEPGQAPAGFVWRPPAGWAAGTRQDLLLHAAGHGRITAALADAVREQRGDPLELGSVVLTPSPGTTRFSVPPNAQPWRALSLVCPTEGARLKVPSVALRVGMPGRSAWAWSPALWADTPDKIWALQKRHALDTVYVTVPTDGGAARNAPLLGDFIAQATARSLRVWAVIGDPADVLPASQAALQERLKAYAAFNDAAPPASRLAGVQMDVEPYLLPGYRLDPRAWRERYLQTVAGARAALPKDLPLDLVVPVWWGADTHWGGAALDRLAPLGVSLTVMNYRTDLDSVRAGAALFLAWSARHGRAVTMALEYGPIPDEIRRHYRRSADGGELWLLPIGRRLALVLLAASRSGLPGTAFRFTHQSSFAGRQITFAGQPSALAAALDELMPVWAAWPHFSGIALHGVADEP